MAEDASKEDAAASQKEQTSEPPPEKPPHLSRRAIVIGAAVVLLIVLVGVLVLLHARHFVSTDDAYTAAHVHQVSSRIQGTVEAVLVDDNQMVQEGQELVRLDPRDDRTALQQAQASVRQAEAMLVQKQAAVTQVRAQLTQAQARLDKAHLDYERDAALYQKDLKAIAKTDVETGKANLDIAQGQYDAAQASIVAAEADVGVAQSNIGTATAQAETAELQLSYCNIYAPSAGKISKKTVESGQRVQPGQALLAIVPDDVWVLANLKETQLEKVRIGQRVDIRIDSLPHEIFYGRVNSIQEGSGATFALLPPDNATGNFTKIVQRVPVKIVFDPDSIRLFRDHIVPGLSVLPKIDLDSLGDNPREPARQKRQEQQNREAEGRP